MSFTRPSSSVAPLLAASVITTETSPMIAEPLNWLSEMRDSPLMLALGHGKY
jgi:hypothetical protein